MLDDQVLVDALGAQPEVALGLDHIAPGLAVTRPTASSSDSSPGPTGPVTDRYLPLAQELAEPGGALAGFDSASAAIEPEGALAGFDSASASIEPEGALAGFAASLGWLR